MSGIEGKKGYYLQKTGARVNELLERHYIVPTFTTSPTEETLSWNDDNNIVYFRIGEIVRVKNHNDYDFYRVDNIENNKISWKKLENFNKDNYYSKEEINEYTSNFLTKEYLYGYYTKQEVDSKIPNIENLINEQDLQDYLDLNKYVKESYVLDTLTKYYTKTEINTIIAGLSGGGSGGDISQEQLAAIMDAIGKKADKATTLEGYGITDAYNKTYIDSALNKFVLLSASHQTIKGDITIEGNLVVKGDMASQGEGNPSLVGASGVIVGATEYRDLNGDGLIDLTSLMALYTPLSSHNSLASRVSTLEGKTTSVSVSQTLTSGKQIGVLTIDGVAKSLYAPSTYDWSEIANQPSITVAYGYSASNFEELKWSGRDLLFEPYKYLIADNVTGSPYMTWSINKLESEFAKYLLLSGGTITSRIEIASDADTKIVLDETGNDTKFQCIEFRNKGTMYGKFGTFGTDTLSWYIVGGGINHLIHSGNYSDYALPLSGGTIKSAAFSPLAIDRDSNSGAAGIGYTRKGSVLGYIGFNDTTGPKWFDSSFAEKVLIHSGNIGEQSVSYAANAGNTAAIAGRDAALYAYYSNSTTYIAFNLPSTFIKVGQGDGYIEYYDNGGWYNCMWGKVTARNGFVGNLTGNATSSQILKDYEGTRKTDANVGIFGDSSVRKFIASSSMTANRPPTDGSILHFSWDTTAGYEHQLFIANNSSAQLTHRMAWRAQSGGTWGDWKSVAFTDSNVASATKLQTARTIWGQSFDGTGNVRGDLFLSPTTDNGNALSTRLVFSGYSSMPYGPFIGTEEASAGGYGRKNLVFKQRGEASWATDFSGHTTAMLINTSGNVTIGSSDLAGTIEYAKLCVDGVLAMTQNGSVRGVLGFSAGDLYLGYSDISTYNTHVCGKNVILQPQGNVGIGTTSPSAKLHIVGDAIVTGDLASGSDIRFKDIINNTSLDIKDIADAPLFAFKWNDREDNNTHLGTSAQYWESISPELVTGEEFKTLNYASLGVAIGISLAKKALSHEERIKVLEEKVSELETENRRLRYGN